LTDMDRKQIMKYAFAAGVVLGVTAAVLILARGCGQEKKVEAMGPEEVAVCFCRAMAAGDFTGAYCCFKRMLPLVMNNQREYLEILKVIKPLEESFDNSILRSICCYFFSSCMFWRG
jgi:hypothetical protein